MSEWSKRNGRAGAFCVLYSPKGAHCEVWPPRVKPKVVEQWTIVLQALPPYRLYRAYRLSVVCCHLCSP